MQAPCKQLEAIYGYLSFVTSIEGMKVRRRMVVVVHVNAYAEEPADHRHACKLSDRGAGRLSTGLFYPTPAMFLRLLRT